MHITAVDFAVRQVEALASTRVMTDGQSETVLTGNLVMALFNHDTSRDQDPQLHTWLMSRSITANGRALLQIVGGDKLIIPFADGAAHEPIQRPAFSA
ncbi:hypothetical protein ECZU31_52900 [Escherichia coli]|nr:hypothetical protein ECZU31_52900 [Escherichia coli]